MNSWREIVVSDFVSAANKRQTLVCNKATNDTAITKRLCFDTTKIARENILCIIVIFGCYFSGNINEVKGGVLIKRGTKCSP